MAQVLGSPVYICGTCTNLLLLFFVFNPIDKITKTRRPSGNTPGASSATASGSATPGQTPPPTPPPPVSSVKAESDSTSTSSSSSSEAAAGR